jgi:hypothetical protein
MTRKGRIDKLERGLPPEEPPFRFRTLNLGAAPIREGDGE